MGLPHTRLTAQGQVSVPAEIRRRLAVGPGSVLEWEARGDEIVVRRAGRYTFEDIHRAAFKTPPKPKTLEELKEGIADYIRAKHARR